MTMPPRTSFTDRYFGHTDAAMDGALWGELQSHIDLTMIYAKLPLAPFFRLRQVCKEWNRLASDRQFLERTFKPPLANSFFIVTTPFWGDRLLTCQASSWSSVRVMPVQCEVSGLLFEAHWGDNWGLIRIFDLHTRVFHTVPPIPTAMMQQLKFNRTLAHAPYDEDDHDDPLIGITVDTTLIPYSFRVILGDEVIGTRIYDSESGAWTQKPSTYERAVDAEGRPSCVNHNQFLYMRSSGVAGNPFDLHSYDLQRDDWNFEMPNAFEVPKQDVLEMGLWRDRLFVFGLKFGPVLEVEVWETDRHPEQPWTLFDSMPGELCAWISFGKDRELEHIQSKFCNEHVLVYNYFKGEEKAVLCNLDRKTWEKVELPSFLRPLQQSLQ